MSFPSYRKALLSTLVLAATAVSACTRHASSEQQPTATKPPPVSAAQGGAGNTGANAPAAAANAIATVQANTVAANASAVAPRDTTKGGELYVRYCALCHGKNATGYAADNAPSLVSPTFLESADDAFIASGIRFGRPNTAMGPYGKARGGPLDELEINAIVAFLRSHGPSAHALPAAGAGDPQRGAVVYRQSCASCHGTEKERKVALSLFNPELLAAASPEFLRYAVVKGRPPTRMPAFEGKLTPQQIDDVVAFIRSKAPQVSPGASAPPRTVPDNLPVVLNPKGKPPAFTLRDERYVPAAQVKKALEEHRRMIIIDARSPGDWLDAHIPGAIPIPYYQAQDLDRIPNDGTWVVAYCACPHHASGEVVDVLRSRGYKHTAVLDEGILVWKQLGYPIAP